MKRSRRPEAPSAETVVARQQSLATAEYSPVAEDATYQADLAAYIESHTPIAKASVDTSPIGCRVKVPYNKAAVEALKKLGGRWEPVERVWWLSPKHHAMVCRIARTTSPDELAVSLNGINAL